MFPIVLLARPGRGLEAGRREDAAGRRLSHVLRHGEPLRLLGALDDGHVGEPIGVEIARQFGLKISFGSWFLAASVPALAAVFLLPLVLYWLFLPGARNSRCAGGRPRRPALDGPLSRDEKVVAVAFVLMVTGWVSAGALEARSHRDRLRRSGIPLAHQRAHAR